MDEVIKNNETSEDDIISKEKAHATHMSIKKSESDVTIFDPRGVDDYMRTYPELRTIEEFNNISIAELKFVWWYSNPTSPLVKKYFNPAQRSNHAYGKVWDYSIEGRDNVRFNNFTNLRFTEPIRLAIERMAKIDYTARYRAKVVADKTFRDYEEMSKLTPEDFRINGKTLEDGTIVGGEIDYMKFANVKKLVLMSMPELIKVKEQGFGVVTGKGKKNANETGDMFDEFLEEHG